MTNQMTNAEKNALSVSYDVMGQHVELDLNFVKNYLVRGRAELVTPQEIVFFMNLCKMQHLNPLVGNEVYCIKYDTSKPAQVVVGKNAYMRRAYENPDYLCKEDGIIVERGGETFPKEGCCLYKGETLVGGWCRIHFMRNGTERTAYKEVAFNEYNAGQANWKSKPATMVNKVAISQCIREAFPKDYEGVYSEDEMVASGAVPVDFKEVPTEHTQPADPPIDQEHRKKLLHSCKDLIDGADWQSVYTGILNELGLESSDGMTMSQYELMMNRIKEIAELRKAGQAKIEAPVESTAVEVPNEKHEPVEEMSTSGIDENGKERFRYNGEPFIENGCDPRDYFRYVRSPNILSMSFEGDLYDILNYGDSDSFYDLFKKYGLYYELGNDWNLTAVPND